MPAPGARCGRCGPTTASTACRRTWWWGCATTCPRVTCARCPPRARGSLVKLAFQAQRRFWEDEQIYGGISWTNQDITQIWYPPHGIHAGTGVILGAYAFDDEPGTRLTRLSPAERIEAALAQGEKVHPDYRRHVGRGVSVAWYRMNHVLGCSTRWTDEAMRDHFATLQNPAGRHYMVGDQISHHPGLAGRAPSSRPTMRCGTSTGGSGRPAPPAEEEGRSPEGNGESSMMQRRFRRVLPVSGPTAVAALAVAAVLGAGTPPAAAQAPEAGPSAPRALYGAACASCHGTDGRGNPRIDAPVLAGLSAAYLARQIDGFRRGYRGRHPEDVEGLEMRPMVEGFAAADLAAVGAWLASLPAPQTVGGAPTARRRWADGRRGAGGRPGARAHALRGLRGLPWAVRRRQRRPRRPAARRAGELVHRAAAPQVHRRHPGLASPTTPPAPPCARAWRTWHRPTRPTSWPGSRRCR